MGSTKTLRRYTVRIFKGIYIVCALFFFLMALAVAPALANLEITTLSTRADMVSDGDVLVKVQVPGWRIV